MSSSYSPSSLSWAQINGVLTLSWAPADYSSVSNSLSSTYSDYPIFDTTLSSSQISAVEQAFSIWATVINATFTKVTDSSSADIRMGFDAIDGASNILGEAANWSTSSYIIKSTIRFDSADLGSNDTLADASFLSVALHEIGHVLGLDHNSNQDSVMYAYANNKTTLNTVDVTNIQALYTAKTVTAGTDTSTGTGTTVVVGTPSEISQGVDSKYYNSTYTDVAAANIDPNTHYALYGWKEGRDPNAYFDTSYYLENNQDIANAGINPLEHYYNYGWKEGRTPSTAFNGETYLAANADVAQAGLNPLEHYLEFGQLEGRSMTV